MGLKLLTRNDSLIEDKSMGLSMRFGRLMPDHVAVVQGLMQTAETRTVAAVKVGLFALREFVSELKVKGESYDPIALGYSLDVRDEDNSVFLLGLTAIVIRELLVSDESKKKLSTPPDLTGLENDVETV